MDKYIGNYLNQSNRDFPLDCETLAYLQTNNIMSEILGNIGGDKIILAGCEYTNDSKVARNEGYVFLHTSKYPSGEVLRFAGGNIENGMYIAYSSVNVTAGGNNYPSAYTTRYLAAGIGEENFAWDDFIELQPTKQIQSALSHLEMVIANLTAEPLGIVKMWAGSKIPEGYALCDGSQLLIADYAALYAALGDTFNIAKTSDGNEYTTESGYFRLPDLRGRFVVGYHDSDSDYKLKGNAGGEKKHTLTEDEMPSHSHNMRDYYYPESSKSIKSSKASNYDSLLINNQLGSEGTDTDNDANAYYEHDTSKIGKGLSHENRPPYYVLAFIMKIK